MDGHRLPHRRPLAQGQDPPPVAIPTARRQDPREEPGALTRPPGSARGALDNQRPYRDQTSNRTMRAPTLLRLGERRRSAATQPTWLHPSTTLDL